MQDSTDPGLEATIQHTIDASAVPPRPPSTELQPGAAVGRYTPLGKLGAGAMGIVYEAFDRDLDRRVAVKRLQRAESAELLGEAQAMAKLAHAHVVAIYDVRTVCQANTSQVFLHDAIIEVFAAAGQGEGGAPLSSERILGLHQPDLNTLNLIANLLGVNFKATNLDWGHANGDDFHLVPEPQ